MIYRSKLIFHVPLYAAVDEHTIVETHHGEFKKELIERLEAGGAIQIEEETIKVYINKKKLDECILKVSAADVCVHSHIKTFMKLVCKYDSDLMQNYYKYEVDDTMVTVYIGEEKGRA
jgi:hypothetical protein